MPKRKHPRKQVMQYIAGIGTEVLFTVVIIALAFCIAFLAWGWL